MARTTSADRRGTARSPAEPRGRVEVPEPDVTIDVTVDLSEQIVVAALVESYPAWTDENGTNVAQLAAIAVDALARHGLLATPASHD